MSFRKKPGQGSPVKDLPDKPSDLKGIKNIEELKSAVSQDLRELVEKYGEQYADDVSQTFYEERLVRQGFTEALDLLWPCVEANQYNAAARMRACQDKGCSCVYDTAQKAISALREKVKP